MPNWNWAGTELAIRSESAVFLWGMCVLFGALLIGALGVFVAEIVSVWRNEPRLTPMSGMAGYGRAVRRPSSPDPGLIPAP
jgi:hypothetical protein